MEDSKIIQLNIWSKR